MLPATLSTAATRRVPASLRATASRMSTAPLEYPTRMIGLLSRASSSSPSCRVISAALRAERDEIFRLARTRQIEHDIARKLVREIDLLETRYA